MRILLTAVVLFAHSAFAQSWTHLAPKGTHPAVTGASGVYDAASDRMIVFGGRDGKGDNRNDVWVLTNANGLGGQGQWINLIPNGAAGSPAPRSGHSAVYDAADNRLIIFGGCGGYCVPALNDVWVLTNANGLGGTPAWTQLSAQSPYGAPAARTNAASAYDPTGNSLIIVGGQDGSADLCSTLSDLWTLSNANGLGGAPEWIPQQNSESDQVPPGRNGAVAVYNPTNMVMTLMGGMELVNGVCRATNAVWQEFLRYEPFSGYDVIAEGAAGSPSARSFPTAVYDAKGERMLLFGGLDGSGNSLNDVWALSNATTSQSPVWSMLSPTGGPPAARSGQSAVFDSANRRMTIFGGVDPSGALNDSWSLYAPGISGLGCSFEGGSNLVNAEGIAEPVGDVLLYCIGGTPTPQGEPIPEYTVSLKLNTNITTRLLAQGGGLSEATLLIDDPFPGAPVPPRT